MRRMILTFVFSLIVSFGVNAEIRPGDEACYDLDGESSSCIRWLSKEKFEYFSGKFSGETTQLDDYGNYIRSRGRNYDPHSGWLPSETLKIGVKWKVNFTADGVYRERSCNIISESSILISQRKFHIFEIHCDNQRLDRGRPMLETIFFSEERHLIEYRSWWSAGVDRNSAPEYLVKMTSFKPGQ